MITRLNRWHQYGVNAVDNTIGAIDVSLDDMHVAIELHAVLGGDLQIGAINCCSSFAVHLHNICGHYFTANHVIAKDGFELWNVFEELVHGAFRELGKRFVCGGENRERSRSFESVYQSCGGQGSG